MLNVPTMRCCAIALLIFASEIFASPTLQQDDKFTIRIVHTNDMHARFEETSKLSTACTPQDSKNGKCYGGFARLATLIRQARLNGTTIFLNAGDTYQGTAWYTVYKWWAPAVFLELLAPDVICLGNHEFDDGVDGLIPFIENVSFPIVSANLDLSEQPNLAATKLLNSTVLDVEGRKIGVIGYLTPETKILSTTEKVIFKDEVTSIREEAKKLKHMGVDILIALGHSGYNTDKKIAEEVEDIDLVIGGHTNTFLYKGTPPDVEKPEGYYPTEIIQASGRKVYVVQAYAYTKYLGNFYATFDTKGEVSHIEGNPILVDSSVKQAKDVLEVITQMRKSIDDLTKAVVGRTRVLLDGDSKSCRRRECNLGNLICDAIIDYYANENLSKNGWTDAAIAVMNSGSIRTSIMKNNEGKVTKGDILSVAPFNNVIMIVSMTGKQILEMLEWSVYHLENQTSTGNLYGSYLQYAGLQVIYDNTKPQNSRVVSVHVQCAACNIPKYSELQKNATYNVFVNDFIAKGGDGFHMLENLTTISLGVTVAEVMEDYFKRHSPVHTGVEWRILYEKDTGTTLQPISIMILISIISWLLTS